MQSIDRVEWIDSFLLEMKWNHQKNTFTASPHGPKTFNKIQVWMGYETTM